MADDVGRPRRDDAERGGDVPLTPIQRWFLALDVPARDHWNQSFRFETAQRIDRVALSAALVDLERHHGALRLRFARDAAVWRQWYDEPGETPLRWVDLRAVPDAALAEAVDIAAASIESTLDLGRGPIWRAVACDAGEGRTHTVAIAIHQLACDGASWRVLHEDLEAAYAARLAGRAPELVKTASFREWAERLVALAGDEATARELPSWEALGDAARLPGDLPRGPLRGMFTALEADRTRALVRDVPAAYGSRIEDVLLTALAQIFTERTGQRALHLALAGDGREDPLPGLDVSRTVGWLSSAYPLRLATGTLPDAGATLRSVMTQLRAVPRRGIGHGLLRHVVGAPGLTERREPELAFNFLGQFGTVPGGRFRLRMGERRHWRDPRAAGPQRVEVDAWIADGRLATRWWYADGVSERAAHLIAHRFRGALGDLIEHCLHTRGGALASVDLPTLLESIRAPRGVPALGAAVLKGAELLELDAVGVRRDGVPVDREDRWLLGSNTKTFTATLFGRLIDRGVLGFDTTLAELFRGERIHPEYEGVTCVQLLQHRGGAPAVVPPDIWAGMVADGDHPEARIRAVRALLERPPEPTRGRYVYAGAGYLILGAAVERLLARRWEESMIAEIFEPLEMRTAGFGLPGLDGSDQPWGHRASGGALEPVPPGLLAEEPVAYWPVGGIHCSLRDWCTFLAVHLASARGEPASLLSNATLRRLQTAPEGGDYACGWATTVRLWAGGKILGHTGGNRMWTATVHLAPAKNLVVVATANVGGEPARLAVPHTIAALAARHGE